MHALVRVVWVKEPSAGRRWQIAWLRVSSTKLVIIKAETRHPTVFRTKTLMKKAAQAISVVLCTWVK